MKTKSKRTNGFSLGSKNKLKIAMLSSPWLKSPPDGYGGAEWVVHHLTEGLVKKGHEVTLFATGDSETSAKLAYAYKRALGNDVELKLNVHNVLNHLYHFMKDVLPNDFDIIHTHAGRSAQYFLDLQPTPFVHTLHGNYTSKNDIMVKYTGGSELFDQFKTQRYISISRRQQIDMPDLNYVGTVYNGVLADQFKFDKNGGDSVVWLGRVTSTKGLDIVVEVVNHLKKKLIFGGWVDKGDETYFNTLVKPHINGTTILYIGEVKNSIQKSQLYNKGKVLLYPLQWEEPFGLVMVEAMATGTPVVAYARGSIPEIIVDGVTGFIVNSSETEIRGNFIIKKAGFEGLNEAVERIYNLPSKKYKKMRANCRRHVDENFSVEAMVNGYEKIYKNILSQKR